MDSAINVIIQVVDARFNHSRQLLRDKAISERIVLTLLYLLLVREHPSIPAR